MSQFTNVHVAGTTFHKLPENASIRISESGEYDGVPYAITLALLVPDPTNAYDPNAIKVVVPLRDGSPCAVGFIPKDIAAQIKLTNNRAVRLTIRDYRAVGSYNPSYILDTLDELSSEELTMMMGGGAC